MYLKYYNVRTLQLAREETILKLIQIILVFTIMPNMYKNQSKNTYTQKSMNKRIIFTIMIKMNMLTNHTLQNLVSKYITSEDCTTRLKHTQKQI